jgi:PIN domain nuclease of toxin-antitoxin system
LAKARGLAVWRVADNPEHDGPLLLDTHTWVWLLEGDASRNHPALQPMLARAASVGNLYVSDISFWEVADKAAKKKLQLSVAAPIWLAQAERAPGIFQIALDRTILIQSTLLPGNLHGDPADRMLIATAQLRSMPLVTNDDAIITYAAATPGVPVCDARP